MNDTIEVSRQHYSQLLDYERRLAEMIHERRLERESWDEVYRRAPDLCCFVLITLDGHKCFVPRGHTFAKAVQRAGDGKLTLFCMEAPKPGEFSDPMRRLRKYVETGERIQGVPILEEVRP